MKTRGMFCVSQVVEVSYFRNEGGGSECRPRRLKRRKRSRTERNDAKGVRDQR
jgi:hypothetical protein